MRKYLEIRKVMKRVIEVMRRILGSNEKRESNEY